MSHARFPRALVIGVLLAAQVPAQRTVAQDLTLRIGHLDEERASLDWTTAVALHATGGVLAGGAALVGLCLGILTPMTRRDALGGATSSRHDDSVLHTTIVAAAVAVVIGAVLVLAGVVLRSDRERRRRAIDEELATLRFGS